ncbi:12-(S)-hydroxy-5,8,10,14-eicosatetraenoic acid receptor [Meriones unguiculatus]|uniref:12-(S)-hydroxy-5,8,10,14-eicosatetraenoic acid receptor n=1 Tax=Meriones unguiculatus TaxID=10047 RepID=UPI000B4F0688|nr:12-(S)-hydroxy-5,8,10,14-eicosatetraenoic acid receptor-like [Meriones unguiculatus]XP_021511151.1 12-(S)-hydroxy-5,8,10,14-eicosatetraenoic acid receptor-like [Meriones unguiculatus]XP_060229446.1 12-(S)-hydroxy-5,8,10,14-eicosatetraenoic acid receptor [Meriones unguiculatus]
MAYPNCSAASPVVDTAMGIMLTLECVLSLTGNAVALWTLFNRLKVWKPYAVYLFNLVVADLLLATCLPLFAAFYLKGKTWKLGHTLCQVLVFLLTFSRGVGVAFLTTVALDRYLRVVHPRLRVNLLSPRAARVISSLIWLLMVALTPQNLLTHKTTQNSTEGPSFYPTREVEASATWQEVLFFLQFLLPFGLISFCNTGIIRTLQRRLRESDKQPRIRRARALVAMVLLLFGLCFLPSVLTRVLEHVFRECESCSVQHVIVQASDIAGGLTCLHGALSPTIYCFSNPAFTYSYRKVLKSLRGRRKTAEPASSNFRDSYS